MKENINGWFFILNWKMNGSYFEVQDLYGYLTTNMSSKCFIWYPIQYYNLKIWKNNHVSINWSCDRGQHYNLRGKHPTPLPSPIFLRSILSLNSELWPQIYAVLFEDRVEWIAWKCWWRCGPSCCLWLIQLHSENALYQRLVMTRDRCLHLQHNNCFN